MAGSHKWTFKARFRSRAYGWRGSQLAAQRLKEAVSEIKRVAKSDPIQAGEGCVSLMERLWPALQDIDTSSGALGTAVARTLDALIPILIAAPCDKVTRDKWLGRLYEAVADDGVQYLDPVEERWGEICVLPELAHEWGVPPVNFTSGNVRISGQQEVQDEEESVQRGADHPDSAGGGGQRSFGGGGVPQAGH